MEVIEELIDNLTEGIELPEDVKKTLVGLYVVSYYKVVFEFLLAFKGSDLEFHKEFNSFYDSIASKLSSEQKVKFDELIERKKPDILKDVLNLLKENLPADFRVRLESNIGKF